MGMAAVFACDQIHILSLTRSASAARGRRVNHAAIQVVQTIRSEAYEIDKAALTPKTLHCVIGQTKACPCSTTTIKLGALCRANANCAEGPC